MTQAPLVDPMSPEARRREVDRRLERVRAICEGRGGAVAVLSSRANVAWLTAGGQHHVVLSSETGVGSLVVTPRSATLVAPSIEVDRLENEEIAGLGIEIVAVPWWESDALDAAVAALAHGRPVLDDAALEDGLRAERSVLGDADIERLGTLGRAAEQAVTDAIGAIEPGASEDGLAASLIGRLVGIRAPVVLVAADERIERFRHPLPGAHPIQRRVMLVLVGEAWGLHVALTRIREFEDPPPYIGERMRAVVDVERAMIEATTPGATLGDVVSAAQREYAKAGRPDEWHDHHQGGTIAYHGREAVATPGDATVIERGMAFAWNPSIAGAKVEDTFVVTVDGSRRFVTGLSRTA
ncbi:MAG TPA: M24 family metallopeptidase [Methylomirabilota bacterium]|nr:M24 family metallopeptidase [Methylomirabilota bacterium]